MMLRFHAQTAGSTLTAQQPDVNIVRVTLQALADHSSFLALLRQCDDTYVMRRASCRGGFILRPRRDAVRLGGRGGSKTRPYVKAV